METLTGVKAKYLKAGFDLLDRLKNEMIETRTSGKPCKVEFLLDQEDPDSKPIVMESLFMAIAYEHIMHAILRHKKFRVILEYNPEYEAYELNLLTPEGIPLRKLDFPQEPPQTPHKADTKPEDGQGLFQE